VSAAATNACVRVTYCITEELDASAIRSAVDQLSDEERSRCSRLLHEWDRRDFAVAHALLRQSLSACGTLPPHEWTFTAAAYGKPLLTRDQQERERLSFNLAHTRGLVACCVARDVDVGIDVEAIGRSIDIEGIAERFFSPIETADLARCPQPLRATRFTELWTLKEAYIKARGDGLSYPLDRFAFRLGESGSLAFASDIGADSSPWSFALFTPTETHRMALAVNRRLMSVSDIELRAVATGDAQELVSCVRAFVVAGDLR
jgi:4'-phosphopantetheinyl transferase